MYLHQPKPTWSERILGSARTLAAIVLTALLASALTVRWSDAAATSIPSFTPPNSAMVSGIPVAVEGSVVGAGDGMIALIEQGAETAVAFPVGETASVMREGQAVSLDALRVGDTVRMTIDGRSGHVMRLHATPVGTSGFLPRVPDAAALLAALGLIAGATALALLNLDRLPALPVRLPASRLLHAQGAR
jgi:predicted regulator of Ras-like GTPase activity (Roadblock/LC7/MglB family)